MVHYSNDGTFSYESTAEDPHTGFGPARAQTGLLSATLPAWSQKKWVNMNGECDGNIDAYSFVYWDASGDKRVNYVLRSGSGPARR